MKLGTKVIAEASFHHLGCFCSVDILVRNDDGSYDIFEVKSSKREKPTKKSPSGVKEKYILDASYQRYVLENCGINVNRVYVVLLSPDYVREKTLELDKYFVKCDVSTETIAQECMVIDKLKELDRELVAMLNRYDRATPSDPKQNRVRFWGAHSTKCNSFLIILRRFAFLLTLLDFLTWSHTHFFLKHL